MLMMSLTLPSQMPPDDGTENDNADDEPATPDVDDPIDEDSETDNADDEPGNSGANELYWWCSCVLFITT